MDLIWAVYPGYSDEIFTKDELLNSVREHMDLAVRVIQRGSSPTPEELDARRGLGEQRAKQGVPLESVIQAYRSNERVIFLDLLAAMRDQPIREMNQYTELILTMFDLLTQQIINSYRDASAAIESLRERAESELMQAFASGVVPVAASIDRWVNVLGLDPSANYAGIAILGDPGAHGHKSQHLRHRLHRALQPYLLTPPLYGDVPDGTLVLVSLSPGAPLTADLLQGKLFDASDASTQVVGVGETRSGITLSVSSCDHALTAARAAMVRGPRTILGYSDALLEAFLMSRPTIADQLVDDFLGPLHGQPHLVETLESLYLNGLSQATVARELFVHVNTVTHRIRRTRELSGRDPLNLEDGAQFMLALRWLKLRDT